jgi:hypothetical protein
MTFCLRVALIAFICIPEPVKQKKSFALFQAGLAKTLSVPVLILFQFHYTNKIGQC